MPKSSAPRYLYKYRRFNVFALSELNNQEIFYCKPAEFNDPLDCKPSIVNDLGTKQLEKLCYEILKRKSDKARAQERMGGFRYSASEFGRYDDGATGQDIYIRYLLREIENDVSELTGDRGVLALSRKWNSMLMWSHYGDEHRGLCFGFEVADHRCELLRPVDYAGHRGIELSLVQKWLLLDDQEAKQTIQDRIFFTKTKTWGYEEEWRAVRSPAGTSPSPFKLHSVTFGMRCDPAIVSVIVKMFSGPPVASQNGPVMATPKRAS